MQRKFVPRDRSGDAHGEDRGRALECLLGGEEVSLPAVLDPRRGENTKPWHCGGLGKSARPSRAAPRRQQRSVSVHVVPLDERTRPVVW